MDEKQQLERIIQDFEYIKEKPAMFLAEGAPTIHNFMSGFRVACAVLNYSGLDHAPLKEVMQEHGLDTRSSKQFYDLETRGLSDAEIAQEVLTCNIEAWKRLVDQWPTQQKSMDEKQHVEKIIQTFEHIKSRPGMYGLSGVGLPDVKYPTVHQFRGGFQMACAALDYHGLDHAPLKEVMQEHGLETRTSKPFYDLETRGLSDDEITQEVLACYIEAWKRLVAPL